MRLRCRRLARGLSTLRSGVARVVDSLLVVAAGEFGVSLPPSVAFACGGANLSSSSSSSGASLSATGPARWWARAVLYFGGSGYSLLAGALDITDPATYGGGGVPSADNVAELVVTSGGACGSGSRTSPPLCPPAPPSSPPDAPSSPTSPPTAPPGLRVTAALPRANSSAAADPLAVQVALSAIATLVSGLVASQPSLMPFRRCWTWLWAWPSNNGVAPP